MKMEQTECSETSAYKLQTPGYYPKESTQPVIIASFWWTFNFLDRDFEKYSNIKLCTNPSNGTNCPVRTER